MPNSEKFAREYRAAHEAGGLWLRGDRSIIEVTGADRLSWLNNLVTNVVKTLAPGDGNYAFAVNIKGRVVADLNMLVQEDRVWLDIDARWAKETLAHFERYIITENVKLEDMSASVQRVAVMGPKAFEVAQQLGFGNLVPMTQLQHVAGQIAGATVRMVRNDLAGLKTADFIITGGSPSEAVSQIRQLCLGAGMLEISGEAVEIMRIEAGLPKSLDDIDDEVVPPETGQIERGINYHKGCYLGQEVIERMRSHGVLARKLCGLQLAGDGIVAKNTILRAGDNEVGRVTSCCWSEALSAVIALGYIKTVYIRPETEYLVEAPDGKRAARLVPLPANKSQS